MVPASMAAAAGSRVRHVLLAWQSERKERLLANLRLSRVMLLDHRLRPANKSKAYATSCLLFGHVFYLHRSVLCETWTRIDNHFKEMTIKEALV